MPTWILHVVNYSIYILQLSIVFDSLSFLFLFFLFLFLFFFLFFFLFPFYIFNAHVPIHRPLDVSPFVSSRASIKNVLYVAVSKERLSCWLNLQSEKWRLDTSLLRTPYRRSNTPTNYKYK